MDQVKLEVNDFSEFLQSEDRPEFGWPPISFTGKQYRAFKDKGYPNSLFGLDCEKGPKLEKVPCLYKSCRKILKRKSRRSKKRKQSVSFKSTLRIKDLKISRKDDHTIEARILVKPGNKKLKFKRPVSGKVRVSYSIMDRLPEKKKKPVEPPAPPKPRRETLSDKVLKELNKIYSSILGRSIHEFKKSFTKNELEYLKNRQFKVLEKKEDEEPQKVLEKSPTPSCVPNRINVNHAKYKYRSWRKILRENIQPSCMSESRKTPPIQYRSSVRLKLKRKDSLYKGVPLTTLCSAKIKTSMSQPKFSRLSSPSKADLRDFKIFLKNIEQKNQRYQCKQYYFCHSFLKF
ncbi:unnamed protein product [Moneuplotes crassus]|uniref:Uncharacterized protein n=1 Tax=Euplotes crassus TaxID=5936 RepID=A0AAD1XGM2_EUPCR|nr:unnamed protein product [Moneuplotes crassus]